MKEKKKTSKGVVYNNLYENGVKEIKRQLINIKVKKQQVRKDVATSVWG
jgi:hypothetical protein